MTILALIIFSWLTVSPLSDNGSDFNDAQALVFEELGESVHKALRSRSSELQYQRQLSGSLLPFLLPSSALGSR